MFQENLSAAMLKLCDTQKLTYETASERCDISTRYFGSIVRKRAAPTIIVLEKLCTGLEATPNDLLLTAAEGTPAFREPMPVSEVRIFDSRYSSAIYPVCPQCGLTLDREYQHFCDRCGQSLDWSGYGDAALSVSK